MRGTDAASAIKLVEQAAALANAGCFAMVLECLPDELAEEMTRRLSIPTIGIGSGPHCDGQVVVTYDLVGLFERFRPRFVKRYVELAPIVRQAASAYAQDVRTGAFPGPAQTVAMSPNEVAKLKARIGNG